MYFILTMEITLLLEFTDRSQLREWLMANHATAKECWVTMFRTKIPRADLQQRGLMTDTGRAAIAN